MSRDDIASCAEEKFPFEIFFSIVETERNCVYLLPFESRSILIYKIIDTNPSIQLIKEIHHDDFQNENFSSKDFFLRLALSPNQFYFVTFASNRIISLYENGERIRPLAQLKLDENRSFVSDLNSWDDQTLIVFYSDGSMSFHEGTKELEEYRYEMKQLNEWTHVSHQRTNELYLIDEEEKEKKMTRNIC